MSNFCSRFSVLFCLWVIGLLLGPWAVYGQSELGWEITPQSLLLYRDTPQQPYWELDPGSLRALQTDRKIDGKLGSYEVKDKVRTSCEQWKDFLAPAEVQVGEEFYFSGNLIDNEGLPVQVSLRVIPTGEGVLEFEIRAEGPGINRIEVAFDSPKDQPAFGFGEQFSYLDRKGHAFWMLVEEQGVGRGDPGTTFWAKLFGAAGTPYTTYCPVPFFFLDAGRAVWLDQGGALYFDLRDPERVWVRSDEQVLRGRIYLGEGPLEVLTRYTSDAGRMGTLPEWTLGTWIGVQGGREKATRVVDEALAAGNPVTGVWIQDWVGPRKTPIGMRLNWDWYPDTTLYPDLKGFCVEMNEKGVKVLGYVNPFLVEGGRLCKEASEKGYLVKNQKGEDYRLAAGGFDAYIIDLSRPEVKAWATQMIQSQLIDNGFSGWMADFGEWLPFDAQLEGGLRPEVFHNQFPVAWMEVNRAAIEGSALGAEGVFFSRSGFSGAGRAGMLLWAGDQMVDWGQHDGMPSAVRALLSSGLSGLPLNHTDLGGYTLIKAPFTKHVRDRELLYRWAEFAAFTPVFRTHEGLRPSANMQVYSDSAAVAFFARMGKLHSVLKPYLIQLNQESLERGWPMVRHLWLHYPEDPRVKSADNCFLLGEELLVFPVLEPNVREIERYFPKGDWVHVLTGKEVKGGETISIHVPLGVPAVFGKKGGSWRQWDWQMSG